MIRLPAPPDPTTRTASPSRTGTSPTSPRPGRAPTGPAWSYWSPGWPSPSPSSPPGSPRSCRPSCWPSPWPSSGSAWSGGAGAGRGSLRSVGVVLLVVAVVGPLVLSLSSPDPAVTATSGQPVPSGADRAELRASLGGGQLRIEPGAAGLCRPSCAARPAQLAGDDRRRPGRARPARPSQQGMLANRGNDWRIRLSTSMAWRLKRSPPGRHRRPRPARAEPARGQRPGGRVPPGRRLGQPAAEVQVDLQLSTGLVDLYLPRTATVEVQVDRSPASTTSATPASPAGADAWRAGACPRSPRHQHPHLGPSACTANRRSVPGGNGGREAAAPVLGVALGGIGLAPVGGRERLGEVERLPLDLVPRNWRIFTTLSGSPPSWRSPVSATHRSPPPQLPRLELELGRVPLAPGGEALLALEPLARLGSSSGASSW